MIGPGLLALALAARAAPVTALPAPALTLPRCPPDPAPDCPAPELTRFAPPAGERQAPARARVRLWWTEAGELAVEAAELPPAARVEVVLSPTDGDDLRDASLVHVADGGVARVAPEPPLAAGQRRALRVGLVVPLGDDGATTLPWAPAGEGDPARPIPTLFTEVPGDHPEPRVAVTPRRLRVAAPGATIRVRQLLPVLPVTARSRPWRASAAGGLSAPLPPDPGWYTIETAWSDRLVARRIWLRPPGPADGADRGIHPAPRWSRPLDAPPLVVSGAATICPAAPAWREAAELLARELARFTGQPVATGEAECLVRVGPVAGEEGLLPPDLPPAAAPASEPEGFYLRVAGDGAVVAASRPRGAVYGALALADAVGPDGASPAFEAADAPAIALRPLVHNLNLRSRPRFDPAEWRRFLERTVARGRYNLVVLSLSDGYRWSSHPELVNPFALDRDAMLAMIQAVRDLDLDVAPGLDSPGHATWITRVRPDLAEDGGGSLLCTRHPDTWPLLRELQEEALALFAEGGEVRWFHVGHDESIWRTRLHPGDERCPRCAGTPRWELLRADLERQAAWLEAHHLRGLVYTDMFVPAWHGRRDGTDRTPGLLGERARRVLAMAAWSPVGEGIPRLLDDGWEVVRQHSGYADWRRAGLVEDRDRLLGEGLGLFTPIPWTIFGPSAGGRALSLGPGPTLLAGTTAWRPTLVRSSIRATLDALADHPAFLPGYRHPPPGRPAVLDLRGPAPGPDVPAVAWPEAVTVQGVRFVTRHPVEARPGAPVQVPLPRGDAPLLGLSLLQATSADRSALAAMQLQPTALRLVLRRASGAEVTVPLRYGLETYRPDGDPRARALWGGAGTAALASPEARATHPDPGDRLLYRWDWRDPHPDDPVVEARLEAVRPGVVGVLAGAVAWLGAP